MATHMYEHCFTVLLYTAGRVFLTSWRIGYVKSIANPNLGTSEFCNTFAHVFPIVATYGSQSDTCELPTGQYAFLDRGLPCRSVNDLQGCIHMFLSQAHTTKACQLG